MIAGPGNEAWQLDGRLDGYAVPPLGGRQLLLSRGQGLEWFEAPPPAPALPAIEIRMAIDPTGKVTGSVVGASGGTVQIFREIPHAPRELVTAAPVTADNSFAALVPAPTSRNGLPSRVRRPCDRDPVRLPPGSSGRRLAVESPHADR